MVRCEGSQLSEEVTKINVGSDAPYRMALHPSGRALVVGLTLGGLRRINIKPGKAAGEPPELSLEEGETVERCSKFGAIKTLSFSADGRQLALGGEDGSIEIVAWPSLVSERRWQASEKAIRNVDFSAAHSDGVVASVDESGACKLWSVASGELVAQLQPPPELPRATFFRCKSSVDEDGIALYTPVKFKGAGHVLRWRQGEGGDIKLEARSSKPVTPSPICGFEVSNSGRLLAAVTPDGDQCVISAQTLRPVKYRKGAHMTFATAVAFAPDDSAIVSTSADASATLTQLAQGSGMPGGSSMLLVLLSVLVIMLAIVVGMLRRLAEEEPTQALEAVGWLPAWAQQVILPGAS